MRWRFWRRAEPEPDDSGPISEQWAFYRPVSGWPANLERVSRGLANTSEALNHYLASEHWERGMQYDSDERPEPWPPIEVRCEGMYHAMFYKDQTEIVVRADTDANALGALPVYLSNLRAGQRIRIEVLPAEGDE